MVAYFATILGQLQLTIYNIITFGKYFVVGN